MVRKTLRKFRRIVAAYKLVSFSIVGLMAAGAADVLRHSTVANAILATVSIVAIFPLIGHMWQDFRSGTYGVDILAALAIVVSLILHQYWAAAIIVLMLTGGESLEGFATARAQVELRDLLRRAPVNAHVLRKGKEVAIRARDVSEREKFVIRPGEVVPADAVIINGSGSFDESSLTGESLPQVKGIGDQVLSGSVNVDGVITAQATRAAADSQYQQIIRLVRAASDSPAPFVRLADRYSIPFTVAALAIGSIAWILSHQPIRFLEVIVVATPCPLILATPIALIAGMSRASREGIIVKTGTAMELLAQAKTFAFDKTGTLTNGVPTVDEIVSFGPFGKQDVMAYAAALEQDSNHALAQAIVNAASQERLRLPKTKHVREIAGRGLEARVKGQEVVVGRYSLLHDHAVDMPNKFSNTRITQTATYVAIGGKLAGYITFKDSLRQETKPTLDALRRLGVKGTLMVTGDNRATASAIAKQLHITRVIAETLPSDKLRAIETVTERPLAFVGDGVNDAPVLTAADIGIALGARGSTAASESADVVIMKDNLAYVARAVALAKYSFRIANESIAIGIGVSFVLMLIFATGHFSPVTGALTQEVLDVLVIGNALRAHRPPRFNLGN